MSAPTPPTPIPCGACAEAAVWFHYSVDADGKQLPPPGIWYQGLIVPCAGTSLDLFGTLLQSAEFGPGFFRWTQPGAPNGVYFLGYSYFKNQAAFDAVVSEWSNLHPTDCCVDANFIALLMFEQGATVISDAQNIADGYDVGCGDSPPVGKPSCPVGTAYDPNQEKCVPLCDNVPSHCVIPIPPGCPPCQVYDLSREMCVPKFPDCLPPKTLNKSLCICEVPPVIPPTPKCECMQRSPTSA